MAYRTIYWLFALVLWCGLVQPVSAGKLYVLLVMNTTDPVIGKSVQIDQKNLKELFQGFVLPNELVFYGSSGWYGPALNFSRRNIRNNILDAIRSCPAGPEDSLVCFWSGHGAHDKEQHYFALPFQNYLFRREVLNLMKTRNAHFTALISDTCNVPLKLPPAEAAPAWPPLTETNPVFRRLFFDAQGILDVNSASPGEEAMGDNLNGGFFTASLYNILNIWAYTATEESQESIKDVQWEKLISEVSDYLPNFETDQTVCVYSLPEKYTSEKRKSTPVIPDGPGTKFYRLVPGDLITHINDVRVHNETEFRQAVRNSPEIMHFDLIDAKTGEEMRMSARLRPGEIARFGAYVITYSNAVRVTQTQQGSPSMHCWIRKEESGSK